MVQPVLKWAGGKRQLLDEIFSRFPSEYQQYHEPFLGGGAVFFALEPEDGTINDRNPRLMNFYQVVRDHPSELIETLRGFDAPEGNPDPGLDFSAENWRGTQITDYYYQQRARFNKRAYADEEWPTTTEQRIEEAALLLYLNRTCYNGLYRENSSGGFNVPVGEYTDPDWVMANRIRAASSTLEQTTTHNDDFEYVLEVAEDGDLVYLDPPYQPMSATANFAEYSQEGFDKEDQKRLLAGVKQLDDRGVSLILSNSAVMFDRYDDAGFLVERESATRAINSDETARGEVDEIIATNVPAEERRRQGQAPLSDF